MVFAPTVTEIRLPHHMWINLRDGIDFWTVVIILVDSVEIVGDKLSAGGFTDSNVAAICLMVLPCGLNSMLDMSTVLADAPHPAIIIQATKAAAIATIFFR